MPVVETAQFRPESQGEGQDLYASPARHQEMTQLMKKHNDRQDEQKGKRVADQAMT
jgi:hypothetical protein